ncbi:MAG: tetratricopeptide repeat protein [Undibacterium sp.]|uniref:serine protease n=1 Tax=Undibacterium sp. TaxID=1914977 RepID=UPI0027161239|nr:serine protease [Undibacterium sp.]MDO8651753.1 tetratricopeptide repeat protein [Undibacterium sp.]
MKSIPHCVKILVRIPVVLATAFLLSIPVEGLALSSQEVFLMSGNTVVGLEVLDDAEKTIGYASATQIDARRFVTACEILDIGQFFRLSVNSAVLDGKILARDRERNLCLIDVKGASSTGILQQRRRPQIGARVFAVSNALGLGVGISEGVVSGIRHFPAGDYIQFTASISPGSEGGALLDEQGQLLGIVDYRHRDGQNVNFASFAQWIDEIGTRSNANAENLKRLDAGADLLKQQKWDDLSALSLNWLREQPDNADALKLSIIAAKGLKNPQAELSAWTELHRVSPTQADVGVGMGRALLSTGRIKEALELSKQLTAIHQEYANARLLLGMAQQLSGLRQEAEESYRAAITLDAWLIEAYQGLSTLAQERGDSATSIAIWSRLSGLYPDALTMRIALAKAYLAADKPDRAYMILEKLPEKDRDSAVALYWRGIVLMRLQCPDAAILAYQKSLAKQFNEADAAWGGIGYAMASMQRHTEAIAAFTAARKANPADDGWAYQLAINLKDGGRSNEALSIMTSLIKKAPELAHYWRQQGFILAILERPAEAIPAMERSLQLEPNQPKLWRALIETCQSAGHKKEAKEAYQKLRAIDTKAAELAYRESILPYEDAAL